MHVKLCPAKLDSTLKLDSSKRFQIDVNASSRFLLLIVWTVFKAREAYTWYMVKNMSFFWKPNYTMHLICDLTIVCEHIEMFSWYFSEFSMISWKHHLGASVTWYLNIRNEKHAHKYWLNRQNSNSKSYHPLSSVKCLESMFRTLEYNFMEIW